MRRDPPDVVCTKCGESVDPLQMYAHWCRTEDKPRDWRDLIDATPENPWPWDSVTYVEDDSA